MSLRDRLEAKARRRVAVRIQVTDPGTDLQRAAEARTFLLAAQGDPDRLEELQTLQEAVDAATRAVHEHFADVVFQALPPDEFEALVDQHARAQDIDRDGLLVALAAECALDEDLRDREWWATQLARPEWTTGEKDDLYSRLFTELHYSVPSGAIPKG